MIAVIVGATGLTGNKLLLNLLKDKEFSHVISLSRKKINLNSAKLTEIILSDLSEMFAVESRLSGDHYFCCLGTTIKKAGSKENFIKIDYDACLDFAKIAKNHNAKSFNIITAKGISKDSKFFYNQVKAKLEEAIIELKLSKILFFRPGLLLGQRKENRLGEEFSILVYKFLNLFLPTGFLRKYVTDTDVLAIAMNEAFKINVRPLNYIESENFADYSYLHR